MLRAWQHQVPTYSSSPMPGGTSKWHGAVMLYCKGCRPKRRHPDLLWVLKEWCNKCGLYFWCCFSSVLQQKDRFPVRFLFYTRHFPATHMHMECCDWLKSVKAASSRRFGYLSAGRSQLTSLPWNQSSERVSIFTSLPHLARHPRPV